MTETNQPDSVDEETRIILDHIYSTTPTTMRLPDGSTVEVPDTGNIGLMAAGYRGIVAWRKKREEKYGKRIFSPLVEIFKQMKDQAEKKQTQNPLSDE
ncbi:MAG: hypothetical protein JW798_09195 [Prolixibacteraceae bacterium]|nr:hypothetical protein [Prolixibacteraceae bacterium]